MGYFFHYAPRWKDYPPCVLYASGYVKGIACNESYREFWL